MKKLSKIEIIETQHKLSKMFLVRREGAAKWLMIDAMWSNSLKKFEALGISEGEISALIVTHIHADHLGLAKKLDVRWLGTAEERERLEYINGWFADPSHDKRGDWIHINEEDVELIAQQNLAEISAEIGLSIEIEATPGHTPDSLSVIVSDGDIKIAFVGDADLTDLKTKVDYVQQSHHEMIKQS
ncbi:MAG: MBL fold metallo-hydrolase [Lactobacillales bacterium]|jgi:glyoxylase-like metal-dependent hydrolase (beta-lactamase superfamily II)|nr:MBL fold metallo-hydrolase [Lactobacillales bacterium]